MHIIRLAPLVAGTFAAVVAPRSAVGACSGDCRGYVHDPDVVYNGHAYYRFSTNNDITIATANDIRGPWTSKGAVLPNGSKINLPGNNDLWAADVHKYNDTYYLYYSVSTFGSHDSDIGIATSPSMDPGTWTDHGSVGIPNSDSYNKIDPNLIQDDSGKLYLTFGSFWHGIHQVQMRNPPLKITGVPRNIEYNSTGGSEGGFQYKQGSFYYLFFSSGACCPDPNNLPQPGEEYKVSVCRSQSSTGPFVDSLGRNCLTGDGGDVILASDKSKDVYGPGGQSVFYDPKLKSHVMVYHYMKPSVGYEYENFFFGWNKLDFSSGWPRVV